MNVPNNPPRESIEIAVINQMNNGYLYPLHKDWTKIESEIIKGFDMLYSKWHRQLISLNKWKQI